jgi:hypothetical protein
MERKIKEGKDREENGREWKRREETEEERG